MQDESRAMRDPLAEDYLPDTPASERCPTCGSGVRLVRHTVVSAPHVMAPCIDAFHGTPASEPTPSEDKPLLRDVTTEWADDVSEGSMDCHNLMIGGVLCRWWGNGPIPSGVKLLAALARGDTVTRAESDARLRDFAKTFDRGDYGHPDVVNAVEKYIAKGKV